MVGCNNNQMSLKPCDILMNFFLNCTYAYALSCENHHTIMRSYVK